MNKSKKYILILFLFFSSTLIFAQIDSSKQILDKAPIDRLKPINPDTVKTYDSSKFVMKKSPMGAVLRSFILPGWGQIYVESYWKAPIATGGCALLIYFIINYNKLYVQKSDLVHTLTQNNPNDPTIQMEKQYREFYRDNRDMSAFYLLATYIIVAVDCYVDAHLFDFTIDDKLSLGIKPNIFGGANLTISYKFH